MTDSLLFTPEVSINQLVHRIQGESLTMTISITKNTNIEDLFKSMDFTIFGAKSDKILNEIQKT